ncbi:hypothetical protein I5K82_16840, partial [Pseudomonas aeruginosa]|nr:hypothetical protein [Pseudomonas aeruginosa]
RGGAASVLTHPPLLPGGGRGARAPPGAAHDALTYRVLIWAMEAASLELLNASDPLELPRVKRVLGDLLVGTLCPSTQAPTRLQG